MHTSEPADKVYFGPWQKVSGMLVYGFFSSLFVLFLPLVNQFSSRSSSKRLRVLKVRLLFGRGQTKLAPESATKILKITNPHHQTRWNVADGGSVVAFYEI